MGLISENFLISGKVLYECEVLLEKQGELTGNGNTFFRGIREIDLPSRGSQSVHDTNMYPSHKARSASAVGRWCVARTPLQAVRRLQGPWPRATRWRCPETKNSRGAENT